MGEDEGNRIMGSIGDLGNHHMEIFMNSQRPVPRRKILARNWSACSFSSLTLAKPQLRPFERNCESIDEAKKVALLRLCQR